jgi:putative ABC transport system ATP-binding protein
VVATHDERMLPLADRIVELSPRPSEHGTVTEVQLAAGDLLFNQGDPAQLVYLVEEGEMELVRLLSGGGEELLARHGPGRYFGELGPMFGLRRSATARATMPSRVIGLPLSEFRRRVRDERTSNVVAQPNP